jgi:hypothetical protein
MHNLATLVNPDMVQRHATAGATEQSEAAVRRLFRLMHGFWGNLFLSRYATGEVENGHDKGVRSAMSVWSLALARYDGDTILAAFEQCSKAAPEYPPSLAQFLAACAARAPRRARTADHNSVKAIPMGQAMTSLYARRARAINARHESKSAQPSDQVQPPPASLDGLKQAIANAVANAGGDEVAELLRLDRMLARRSAA